MIGVQVRWAEKEKRTSKAFGAEVEESTEALPEPQEDFWEGEGWEWLGKAFFFFVPALVLGAAAVGGFAAYTYNNDANVFLRSADSDDSTARLIVPAPVPSQAPPPMAGQTRDGNP
ncbi:hypothetical protein WJX72_008546 [[Myrmecia] bisecta]|uniref:Uncharacterized protein n=1 Tax=[Myrmecia] bisecta TaxID=41462 RepID=A0AAW1P7D2_9CHLO